MYRYGIAPLFLATLVSAVSALDTTAAMVTPTFSSEDLYTLFIGGIIYLNLFVVFLTHILRKRGQVANRPPIVRGTAILIGISAVAIGSVFVVFTAMVLLAEIGGITLFSWTEDFFAYVLADIVPVYTGAPALSMTAGLLIAAAAGFIVFLIGSILLVRNTGDEDFARVAMPTASGSVVQEEPDRPEEPLNPVLSFRAEIRRTRDPAPDVKVILRQREGMRFHTKFTDFNGEVTFTNVEGYGSEYYAYVEGDENRTVYRVIRI
ncbi:hypothetical protein [uncultured Methanofollis sp.]|uniref:hypothetical protein n=1 Tax=uncultured Methanofollis sp. TaxID=262500 RepID=UPI00262A505D|nr:hypothetical protein [uncultured Methanofollis sp.]